MRTLLLYLLLPFCFSQLQNQQVSVSPSTARSSSTFQLFASLAEDMQPNSKIWMFIPADVSALQNSLSTSCNFQNPVGVTATCSYQTMNDGRILYKIENIAQFISFGEILEIKIEGFQNPSSTKETESFQIDVYNQNAIKVDSVSADVVLEVTAAQFEDYQILSSSDVVAATGQQLNVQFAMQFQLQQDEYIAIKFPYLNSFATSTSSLISMLSNPSVESISSMPSLSTEWSSSLQTLYIKMGSALAPGTINFKISQIQNPLSTARLPGFEISTMTSDKLGFIESTIGKDVYLKVYTAMTIDPSYLQLTLDNTKVQNYAEYQISVSLPIPVNKGCKFEFSFDGQNYIFDEGYVTQKASGAMGSQNLAVSRFYTGENTEIRTLNGCSFYTAANNPFIFRFQYIKNNHYVTTTPPIIFKLYDSADNIIAQNVAGLQARITPGEIDIHPFEAHPSEFVLDYTDFHFLIHPESSVTADSQLIIKFSDLDSSFLIPQTCKISDFGTLVSTSVTCVANGRTLTLQNLLREDYVFNEEQVIEFDINGVRLPVSTKPLDTVIVEIYTKYQGVYYLVDSLQQAGMFTAKQRTISYFKVLAKDLEAYKTGVTYEFQIKLSAYVPAQGVVKVTMSTDVEVYGNSRCGGFSSQINRAAYCDIDTSNQMVSLINGFPQDLNDNSIISFEVTNIRNPRSLKPSTFFVIQTLDSAGYLIEESFETAFVEMASTPKIQSVQISSKSKIVGEQTDYYFKIVPAVPIVRGDVLQIRVPDQISTYIGKTLSDCYGVRQLKKTLTCYEVSQNTFRITMDPSGSEVSTRQTMEIKVSQLSNPNSTAKSDNFEFWFYDSGDNRIMETDKSKLYYVQAEIPALLQYASVSHSSKVAGEKTKYSFSIRITHQLPPGSFIRVQWPDQVQLERNDLECQISTRPEGLKKCRLESASVYFYDINEEVLQIGKTIQFSIFGLRNSLYAEATDSFIVTTLSDKFTEVDWTYEGLTVENNCDWPCLSCDSDNRSSCRTCQSTSDFYILHQTANQCVDICPSGFYEANRRCNKCDDNCYECEDTAKHCTWCNPGSYLLGNTCLNQCPFNSIVNEVSRLCVMCEYPCNTCINDVDICTSCLSNIDRRYFWKGQCIKQCPRDITVYTRTDGFCSPCDDNCKTCEFETDVCTSCQFPLKLDEVDHKCKESCPEGISADTGDKCVACNSMCATCQSDDKDKCVTCQKGLSFVEWDSECVTQCPSGSTLQFIKGQQRCEQCDKGCLSCAGTTEYCTKCDEDHLFYKFTCLKKCPPEYKRMSDEDNVCIPERESCRYGYAYNQYGECQVINILCENGTLLNETLNKCLPRPTLRLPFLFLGLAILWAIIVLVTGKNKPKIPQLLLGWNVILQFSSFLLIFLYGRIGVEMISKLNTSVIVFIIFENVMMTLWIIYKSQKHDKAFGHWCSYNSSVSTIFLTVTTWWSFKMARCYYCKFLNSNFNAAFDNKFNTIVRPLFALSMVHFALFQIPVMFTDVYTLMTFGPEYEITTCALDNLVLQLIIFVLEIIEFNHLKEKKTNEEFLPTFKRLKYQQQVMVKNVVPDDEDFSKMNVGDSQLLPLNIMENEEMPRKQKKEFQARALRLHQEKRLKETEILEELCKRLEQKSKFMDLANQDNLPHNYENNALNPKNQNRRAKQENLKALKQKFTLKKTFVIREKKKDYLKLVNSMDDHDIRDYKNCVKINEKIQRDKIDEKIEQKIVRLNKSFEIDILRIDHENLGDNLSEYRSDEDSAFTFPLCADDHRIDLFDPRERADLEIFREKLKSKFNYDNCYTEKVEEQEKPMGPIYNGTQTCIQDLRDPFELSEESLQSVEEVEEEEYLFGDIKTNQIIQQVLHDGVSEDSSQNEDHVRKAKISKFRKDSLKFEEAIHRKNFRSDQVVNPSGILLVEHLDPTIKALQQSETSSIYRPVNPQDIIAQKLREQEISMNEEMRELGIDEDFLLDEEHKVVQSEYEKLQELSMGKPSDEESLDLEYDKKSVQSQIENTFQFTALKKVKNQKRNKRAERLQKAYGKKNKTNFDMLSNYKKTPVKKKDVMADFFPELALQESQMVNTERKSDKKSGVSTMSSRVAGMQSQELKLKSRESSDLGAQLGKILIKRQENRNKILQQDNPADDDLEMEMEEILNGSPKSNSQYKDLFQDINQPSTNKKEQISPDTKPIKFNKFEHLIYDNIKEQKEKVETNKILKVVIDDNIHYEKQKIPKPFDPENLLEKQKKKQLFQNEKSRQSTNKFDQVKSIYENTSSHQQSIMKQQSVIKSSTLKGISETLQRSSSAVGNLRNIQRHNYVKAGLEISKNETSMDQMESRSIRSSSQIVKKVGNFYPRDISRQNSEGRSEIFGSNSSEPERNLITGMQHTLNIMALQRQKARKTNAELILKNLK